MFLKNKKIILKVSANFKNRDLHFILYNVTLHQGGEKMNDNDINKLIQEFKIIAQKGWIKSISKSFGSIGLTFEKELNKKADNMYFPDYYGIEIKCTSRFSRYPLYLFTIAFDGPTFPEINRIVEKYGYYDKKYTDKKVLYEKLNCQYKTTVNNKYQFKLEIDDKEEKLYLCVYDLNDNLTERKSFVYLNSIYNHLMLKLNKLAIVYASNKKINEEKHFRYYKINMYEIISFERFLELLKIGEIDVSLIARIEKSGVDAGRYRNKNLVFQIKKDKINKIFKEIYSYNHDSTKK